MKQVTDFFDGMKMPQNCANRIHRALEEGGRIRREGYVMAKKPTVRTVIGVAAGAVACLVLLLAAGKMTLQGEPDTAATVPTNLTREETDEKVAERKRDQLEQELEALQEAYRSSDKALPKTLDIQDWLREDSGKLWFCPEEEEIYWEDITAKISREDAYIYSRVREDGTVLFLAVGGEYDATAGLQSIGWYGGIWDGEVWTVRGENYGAQRWFAEKVGDAMEQAPMDAMLKAAAKADFEDGLVYKEGAITYAYRNGDCSTTYDTDCHTPFTQLREGRVYFVASGEEQDITGLFSETEPYTYIYTDSHLLTHYIAIGGTAENPGWLEMIRKSWETGMAVGAGGTGVNTWNNTADERYGWETRAKEIFEPYGVHWTS